MSNFEAIMSRGFELVTAGSVALAFSVFVVAGLVGFINIAIRHPIVFIVLVGITLVVYLVGRYAPKSWG